MRKGPVQVFDFISLPFDLPFLHPFHRPPCTTGLKKVTNEMKTYKNPALKASSVVKASDTPKPSSAPKPAAAAQKKPPVFQLQGKRWAVVSGYVA